MAAFFLGAREVNRHFLEKCFVVNVEHFKYRSLKKTMYYYSTESVFRNGMHTGMLKRARGRQARQLAGQIKREAGTKVWEKGTA